MERTVYKELKEWRLSTIRKPLLIRGARQVGKTYIVDDFGNREFDNYIKLNFERNPEFISIFDKLEPNEILEKIHLFTGKNIDSKNTLIFLDEIQDCPNAIMSLRYFYEEMPELHIIGAGSLLEFSLQQKIYRMPVGRIQYLYMYPLSFVEFLNALGQKPLCDYISNTQQLSSLTDDLHNKLLDYTKKYFILGGMPAVVHNYIKTGDVLKCQQIQHSIIETYRDDFAKYARKSQFKYIQKVFLAIPSMISDKLVYSHIDNSIKSRDLKEAIDLLVTAGVIYKVKKTSGDGLPLSANAQDNYFKPLFLDIGLVHAINGIYSETIQASQLTDIYRGAVAEQFVGQELHAYSDVYTRSNLYYWVRAKRGSSAEIDYLIIKNEKIVPVEVKSGVKGKMKSLHIFQKTYNKRTGFKISQAKYSVEHDLISVPLYAVQQLTADA